MRSMLPGVLLVLAAANASAQASWVVDRVPILDISGTSSSGGITFGYAAGGTRLSDGHLLIVDRAENSIRVFDASEVRSKNKRQQIGPVLPFDF